MLPSPFQLINESLKLFKTGFASFFKIILKSAAMVIAAVALPAVVGFTLVYALALKGAAIVFVAVPLILLGLVLVMAAVYWNQLALIYAIDKIANNQKVKISEAFAKTKKRIFSFWVLGLTSSLLIIGASLLFIIPGILLSIWFTQKNYTFFFENEKGANALARSKGLIRGRVIKVIFNIIVFNLALGLAVALPSSILDGAGFETWANIYSAILSIITMPITTIFGYVLYKHLVSTESSGNTKKAKKTPFVLVSLAGYFVSILLVSVIFSKLLSVLSEFALPQETPAPQSQSDFS